MLSLTSVIVMLQYIYSFIDMLAVLLYEQQYCTQRPYFVSAINGKPLMLTIPDFISNFLGDVFHYLRLQTIGRRNEISLQQSMVSSSAKTIHIYMYMYLQIQIYRTLLHPQLHRRIIYLVGLHFKQEQRRCCDRLIVCPRHDNKPV